MKIIPAILTDKPQDLRNMIKQAEDFCDLAQIDIMDGRFVPSKSISAEDLAKIKTGLKLEIHLMVEEPTKYLESFKRAGAKRIVFHYESKEEPSEVIEEIRALGLEAGIAINPETPVADVEKFFKDIDILLFLSVNPGFYGSKFLPEVCEKAKALKDRKDKPAIAMDGGIKADNILLIRDSGVDIACVGSGIYGKGDAKQNYQELSRRSAGG
ncbi:MAG: ribulose-phosphate 3-epimerase [Candidatus Omnitrophota bacterium]|nr:ribulose-phosphate 3-epimerase [Candidatus Omnitrophota bacterium]